MSTLRCRQTVHRIKLPEKLDKLVVNKLAIRYIIDKCDGSKSVIFTYNYSRINFSMHLDIHVVRISCESKDRDQDFIIASEIVVRLINILISYTDKAYSLLCYFDKIDNKYILKKDTNLEVLIGAVQKVASECPGIDTDGGISEAIVSYPFWKTMFPTLTKQGGVLVAL